MNKIKGLLHGGDYNPEQWLDRPDILAKDIEMMKKARVNCVTMGVFSWSSYEPVEGEYHFGWLQERMDSLYQAGIYTILATPSGARPAWLDKAYPKAMRVNKSGVRNHHGVRHNHCMSSPYYRKKTTHIDQALAHKFGNHKGLLMWHISNEFGGECYCPQCVHKFREYLQERFNNNIEALNKAWWTTFWSHQYNSFEQIEPPFANGEGSIMGLNLAWKRFTTYNHIDFMKSEIAAVKAITPNIPVTTNFMKLYNGIDYHTMAKELDVISWDSYPKFHNDYETLTDTLFENSFDHTVMRSLKKDTPFLLMESVPSLVNWHEFNKVKRPKIHRLSSLQAIANGSDSVQYFQWRKSRGSFEQYHGAVVDHLGTDDTRVFMDVAELGKDLQAIAEIAGTTIQAKCALIFDWENRWSIEDMKGLGQSTKQYERTCLGLWKELSQRGVETDIISLDDTFDDYDVVIAPMIYMLKPETSKNLKNFVSKGGHLLTTYLAGYVDQHTLCYLGGFPGDGLSDLFGVISEEIDTLYPSDKNYIQLNNTTLSQGAQLEVSDYAEILRVQDATVLGCYTEDFYQGTPAITCKQYGQGKAYYIGARIQPGDMGSFIEQMLIDKKIAIKNLPKGVEYHKRIQNESSLSYELYLNYNEYPVRLSDIHGTDILSNTQLGGEITLQGFDVLVLKRSNQCMA